MEKIVDLDRVLKFLVDEKVVSADATWDKVPFYKPQKSSESEDGYQGRVGMHEVLKVTPTIREMIVKGASQDEIEEQAKKEGMVTMVEDGIFQAALGVSTLEEVFRVVSE